MKRLILVSLVSFFTLGAGAAQMWSRLEVQANPGAQAAIVAGFDAFNATAAANADPVTVYLSSLSFNGQSPSTHSFSVLHASRTDMANYWMNIQQTPEWIAWSAANANLATPVSDFAAIVVKGWGEPSNSDTRWVTMYLNVSDPEALLSAFDKQMNSSIGKKFPGQMWLSQIEFGHDRPGGIATHVLTSGYESTAERESWMDRLNDSKEGKAMWASLRKSSRIVGSDYHVTLRLHTNGLSIEDIDQQ